MSFDPLTGIQTEEWRSIDGTKVTRTTDLLGRTYITTTPSPTIETTMLSDTFRSCIVDTMSPHTIEVDKKELESTIKEVLAKVENIKEGDIPIMNVYKEDQCNSRRYRVTCDDSCNLLSDRILKNLSVMKSRLMMECAPVRIKRVECKMTPRVKQNIIQAYRKLNMFGKKTPFVARFDEYGRRLEDDVKIETLEGMTISIVDPKYYGELYLEFTGVIEDIFYSPYKKDLYRID